MIIRKILHIVRRDGFYFTLRRSFAYIIGHSPWWNKLTFSIYPGVKICLAPSMLTYVLFASKNARKDDVSIIKLYVKPGSIVVDIGAHIGSTALVSAALAGKEGRVLACEPSPRFFNILSNNVSKNFSLSKKITCFNAAIGSYEGKVHLDESVADDTTNFISDKGTIVSQKTLDDLTSAYSEISFLKVDVEGYELEVLKGASNALLKTKTIYIEFCTDNFKSLKVNPAEIITILNRHFSLFVISDNIKSPFIYEEDKYYAVNLIGERL